MICCLISGLKMYTDHDKIHNGFFLHILYPCVVVRQMQKTAHGQMQILYLLILFSKCVVTDSKEIMRCVLQNEGISVVN